MTAKELALTNPKEIRKSSDLMRLYIKLYEDAFSVTPNCAGCTFNRDFKKFKRAILQNGTINNNQINIKIMETKGFKIKAKHRSEILTYRIGTQPYRSYGRSMTLTFALNYLKHGTKKQIEARKKQFAVLPDPKGLEVKDPETVNSQGMTVEGLKKNNTRKELDLLAESLGFDSTKMNSKHDVAEEILKRQ